MITRRTKLIAIGGLGTVLLSVSVLGGLSYGISFRKHLIEERARAWVEAEERRTQLSSLAELVEETKADRERLASYALRNDSVIDFLAHIERTARDIGLAIETKALNVEPLPGSETFEHLALTVEVMGSSEAVSTMASLIETLPYQVVVRKVSIDRTGRGSDGREGWRGSFDIRVTKYK